MSKIKVNDTEINILSINNDDFISITDIAKYKTDDSSAVIGNWMRNRNTLEFLGVWETLYNHNFKPIEFEGFKKEAGLNSFTMSPQKWVNATNAFGLKVKSGSNTSNFDFTKYFNKTIKIAINKLNKNLLKILSKVCFKFPLKKYL